jgi:gp33|nr:MAG TPA: HNH endonuclease [Caudoviricetes sp.]
MSKVRADKQSGHRSVYEKNRIKILKTRNICEICGKPIDMSLKTPHPLSPVIDHIVPINKGGHPSDINNLQIAHRQCNRAKSDKLFVVQEKKQDKEVIGNRNLPQSLDWTAYNKK